MLTARRYGADEAVSARIVDRAVPIDDLLAESVALAAAGAARDGDVLRLLKGDLYRTELQMLLGED
jgi:enoyl-CoA hydratase/carnithine racemase